MSKSYKIQKTGRKSKRCVGCGRRRPLKSYHADKRSADGKTSRCSKCLSMYARQWRADHPNWNVANKDKLAAYARTRYRAQGNPSKYGYRWRPGESYEVLLERQGGRCAICGTDKPGNRLNERFSIDHDHETGFIRGLLCGPCNRGLGIFKDSIVLLSMALLYLKPSHHAQELEEMEGE